ncbi:MAG: heavy metal translocating P-type ATPase [Xanthomonadales bacterium]|nr:heavy metal translocating P-type ATPase [Xanthomonadales bacterium]
MQGADQRCFHCGEPIPVGTDLFVVRQRQRKPVCCAGCQAVAELIFGTGLGRYYEFRQALGRKAAGNIEREMEAWRGCDQRESLWGVESEAGRRELLLQTEGIRCAACAWLIRSHLESLPGVRSAQVDTATGYTRIDWSPEETRLSRLAGALMELGYKPHLPLASEEEQGRQQARRDSMKRLGVAGLGMMQVMMYAVGLYAGDAFGIDIAVRSFLEWVSLLVTLPVLLYSGRVFFEGAWRSIRAGRPGMDVPVALAIGLAFLASCVNFFRGSGEVWFDSVVMFIFFLSLGRHIEMMLRHRNLQAGAALARLLPEWAERLLEGGRETVPATDLAAGDRILVRAGEAIPADGLIRSGRTEIDEALMTGESRALPRGPGEAVIAGTINLSQPVEIEVTASGQETTISSLGRLLLRAQSRRPASSGIPSWLVPAFIIVVLSLAVATWFGWQLVDASKAFPAMLAVLVASCPCALSLALPAVHAAASRRLLDEGVLLTDGDSLHALTAVDTAVFDKTGTLTCGVPEIVAIEVNPARPELECAALLQVAAALESASSHPIARAFQSANTGWAAGQARALPIVEKFLVHPAEGLEGHIDGQVWRIGQAAFAASSRFPGSDDGVWLADSRGWAARFELRDGLREDAAAALDRLREEGIETVILSGDSAEAVQSLARRLGVEHWYARQSPEDKLHYLEALRQAGKRVLMVGDGVNDAPVLAAADVSMTVKGGAELANSAADMILTGESLALVNRVRGTARRTRQLVIQNLSWAIVYNASVMPLAVSGLLKPWMAALGMSLSSLLVVANAARLAREKRPVRIEQAAAVQEVPSL